MNDQELKICIIGIYFGKLPDYFKAWLLSCDYNPTIDFLVFLDDEVLNRPDNVKIKKSSLSKIKELIDNKLNIDCYLESEYKLCDYRPAYGLIFEDYLKDYDYWGHCDFDMVFGDLRKFFIYYNLQKYDKFLPLGHLSLYKNDYENNHMFMKELHGYYNYQKVFTDSKSYVFDEIMMPRIYYAYGKNFFDKVLFADIYNKLSRYTLVTNVKYYPEIFNEYKNDLNRVNFKHQLFYWRQGKVYRAFINKNVVNISEYVYIHFQKRKVSVDIKKDTLSFYISQNKIWNSNIKEPNKEDIYNYNPYNCLNENIERFEEFIKHCWSYFKRRIIKTENSNFVIEKK